jgi:hypothetical protein
MNVKGTGIRPLEEEEEEEEEEKAYQVEHNRGCIIIITSEF